VCLFLLLINPQPGGKGKPTGAVNPKKKKKKKKKKKQQLRGSLD
jgi:hypothetical protein